jgi:son of sevenless
MYNNSHSYTSTATTSFVEDYNRTQQQPLANEQQYFTTFFCRALYDYQTNDASSLSFRKNDIIEVRTQLESGWWDGLLGDERGWFPSNYVAVISDEEAESALSGSDHSLLQNGDTSTGSLDLSSALLGDPSSDHEPEWMNLDLAPSGVRRGPRQTLGANGLHSSDFWLPEVAANGQVGIMPVS